MPLTFELLDGYQKAALANAESLLAEARLLLTAGHFARAYFLAVAAIEEIGKANLAFSAKGRNLRDEGICRHVMRSFEDHAAKIRGAFLARLHNLSFAETSFEESLHLLVHLQQGREPSMYVDFRPDGSIAAPNDLVRPVAARDCTRLAEECLRHTRSYVASDKPTTFSSFADKLFTIRPERVAEMFKRDDFEEYLWDFLETREGFALSEALVTYHDGYFMKDRRYIRSKV